MNPQTDPKAIIIDKLKSANNVLVTVSANPTVDQLAACIAMTLLLNKNKKNATAVFSGKVPSVLEFLHPDDTIEKSTDSLRDFIIAIDKSKADKLRYKLEDDVVKIFITPYRTSITESDLKYSAGDFNVDVILALGVKHQQDLDAAITAHGRIFHDAVTISINNAPGGDFGIANWEDVEASSLSEIIANLIASLGPNLLDPDIATALLTGIVAETSRFSNDRTHPGTLTVCSTLLAAGADQQLVNTKLQDLIGVVVNLKAGDEIVPTLSTQEPVRHDVAEELIIDENGTFKQPEQELGFAEPAEALIPERIEPLVSESAPADDHLDDALGDQFAETDTVGSNDTVPEVVADVPVSIDDDADSARQAVENALGTSELDAPQSAEPQFQTQTPPPPLTFDTPPPDMMDNVSDPQSQPELQPEPGPQPQSESQPEFPPQSEPQLQLQPFEPLSSPAITPIDQLQPSYANPATMTQYDMPEVPEHEPAPLGMSPADQAFTMPMPPASSLPSTPPPVFPPAPPQQPPAGNTPPPLPPPMMPN